MSLDQFFKEKAVVASTAIQQIIAALDDFPLPKGDKVLVYKRFAIPKMRWILMVQDILPTRLSKMNCKLEGYVKTWWHAPRSTSRDALRQLMGLPSLLDLAEQGQCIKHHLAQSSSDPNVNAVWVRRKALRYKPIRKLTATFGPSLPKSRKEAKKMLAGHQAEHLRSVVAKLVVQGQWGRLPNPPEELRRWRCVMWGLPSSVAQFASKAAIDVLPTRTNLARWKVSVDANCPRCGVKETLHHVLNNCSTLLHAGAYKWRHDSILSYLHSVVARDAQWSTIGVDLPGFHYALPFTADAAWRPDLVLLDSKHNIHLIELTVSFETNSSKAHERKTEKYQTLLQNARDAGLLPRLHCIEMGSRGMPSPAWSTWCKRSQQDPTVTRTCSRLALQASSTIWACRYNTWHDPPLLCPSTEE